MRKRLCTMISVVLAVLLLASTAAAGTDFIQTNVLFAMDNGMTVGIFGLTTPETLSKANRALFPGLRFMTSNELYACAQAQVDELQTAEVNVVNDAILTALSKPFAVTEVLLNGERSPGVRTEETNLGDFCCDAMLWSAKRLVGEQVVAAISNGGGIRASIQVGNVTMNDMKTVFPFGNTLVTLDVTGAELLEALEAATFIAPDAIGAFPQVAGIEFTVDTTVPFTQGEQYANSAYFAPAESGSRVTIATVGGEAFDPEAVYTICTNNFIATGGDTYGVFAYAYQQTDYDIYKALEDALVDYVTKGLGGAIAAPYNAPQGRITILQ